MNLPWLAALISHARRDGLLSTEFQFVSSEAVNLHDDLVKQTLRAAFLTGPLSDPHLSDLQCMKLFRDSFALVLGSKHPLTHNTQVPIDQLQNEPVVWLRCYVDPFLYDSFMASCAAQGYRPKTAEGVRTFYECLQFAREGIGITFLPPFMKSSERDDAVVFVCLPEGTLHAEYTLAYCRNGGSRGVEQFVGPPKLMKTRFFGLVESMICRRVFNRAVMLRRNNYFHSTQDQRVPSRGCLGIFRSTASDRPIRPWSALRECGRWWRLPHAQRKRDVILHAGLARFKEIDSVSGTMPGEAGRRV